MHRTNQRGSLPSILRPADIPPAPPSVGNSPGRSLVQAQSTRAPMPNDAELGHSWSPPSALFSAGVSPSRTFSGNAKAGTSTRLGATHSADVMDGDRTIGVSPARSTLLSPMSTMNSSMASRATAKAARAAAELNQEGSSSSYHNKFLFGDRGAQPWNDRLQNSPTRSSPPSLNEEDEADALMGVVKNIVTRKGRRIFEMETVLARNNTRTAAADPNQRIAVANKTTDELAQLYPALATILQHLQRLTGDLGEALNQTKVNAGTALQAKEAELIQRFESFFEKKLSLLLREKKQVDGRCKELETQLYQLREERDKDLMDAKKVVMSRLNDTEKKEDELRYFRQLIASVFQTNAQLTNRIFDLETLLKVNRIELPPAPSELYQFRSQGMSEAKSAGLTDAAEESSRRLAKLSNTRHISEQVSPEFIAASKEEMNHARLTLQNELLHCAFDDRSAYRLQVKGLRMENIELKYRVSQLEEKVSELNQYIHEHRFVAAYDETDAPLTPRPRDVPFEIQSELGIDFKHSTAHIMAELAAVAINQKHQFSSVLLRLRQMTTVSEWMQEETLLELTEDRNEVGVLPTFPLNSWPTIPHFLRTNITPDVSNLRWSQADAAAVMLEFFKQYRTLRKSCRYIRDNKMVAPRQYQLFERRETILARLDATKEEVELSEDNVPFGYIVSQYINDYLMEYQLPGTNVAVTLPGTLHSHFTLRRHERVVEMEFTRFAYNLWWAAQRYRHTQPLCRLFLDVLNGRLPIGIFEQMEQSMEFVRICISRLDSDGSHTFTYPRLVNGIIKMTADLDAQATRCGILAVAQTFEENEASFLGGRVRLEALMADESFCLDVAKGGESIRATNNNNLPPRITARLIAGRCTQPPGASVFHRYWRRLIMVRFEKVYNMVERVLAPLVVESEVVLGLYLLPVPEALLRVRAFNASPSLLNQENLAAALGKLPLFPEDAALDPEAANDPENPDKKSAPGMPDVTANYQELLEERREVINSRRVAEGTRVETVVNGLLSVLPRLNRAVHFPFSRPPGGQEPSVSNADGVSDGGSVARRTENRTPSGAAGSHAEGPRQLTTAGSTNSLHQSIIASKRQGEKKRTAARRRKSRKGMEHVALPEEMMVQSDKEMVEWFGFCYALRQHLPTFGESLFQPPIAATALNLLSMSASITSTLLDEMAPPDPINGLHKDNDGGDTLKILSSGEHEITSIKKDHSYNI